MANTKTTKSTAKRKSTKVATKAKSEAAARKQEVEAAAKAKVAKLREMELEHQQSQRGRKVVLMASLLLNLFFIVAIYAIVCNMDK
ncbi:MAG: hypothetical protein Q4C83_02745 [Candidatus Saccharibacteria bacterium]|nr:hypothetical protein [Candidatus Saccharibacteria bacterium]